MKKTFTFLLLLGGGGLIGYFGARLLLDDRKPDAVPLLPDGYGIYLLLLLPILYFLVVGMHELGHVAAGRWQDFSFYGLTIGPFSWRPDDDGRIRFHWNTNLNLAGGVAIMLPEGNKELRQRFTWFAAGGPIASVLLAVVAYLLSQLLAPPAFGYFLLITIALFSALIFLATILPSRAGGFASDGMRILTFLRNGPAAEADLAGLQAMAHLRTGAPYAALPTELMDRVAADEKIPTQQRVTMDYYRYLQQLAAGNLAEATALYASVMDRLDAYPSGTHGGFYLEQSLFAAQYQGDLAAAEAALAQAKDNPLTEALGRHLAGAAIARLKEDWTTLRTTIPLIERDLPKAMDQSRTPIIKNWLADWKEALPKTP